MILHYSALLRAARKPSLPAYPGLFDEFSPFPVLGLDMRLELLRRTSHHFRPLALQTLGRFVLLQHLHDFPVETFHDRLRRLFGSQHAVPLRDHEILYI